ncbi:MAG: ASCH domain-containing protein [Candidatus Peribacteraceae bacterium]|nr:ASCH domain-containing protein [Candidatus Peribacteraceae bacterium]
MKALSVRQPWAALIATGIKTIETRTWATSYRGDLLICSGLKPFKIDEEFGPWKSLNLIYGHALCVVKLTDCRPMVDADCDLACCAVYNRAYSWVLEDIRPIQPFDVKGQLRLFEVDVTCHQEITKLL